MRYLIVSNDECFKKNMRAWYKKDIDEGVMIMDFASTRKEADELLKENSYNHIFHNGAFIVDLIEKYQKDANVIHQGETKNHIYNETIIGDKKVEIDKKTAKKPLYLRVNMGTLIVALSTMVAFVVFITVLNFRAVDNTNHISSNAELIKDIDRKVSVVEDNVRDIKTYMKLYFELNNVKISNEDKE